jgi:short-subunit dehydrogenase
MAFPLPSPDSTCLVTGASAGIGEEIARELARRGYNVTITARRAERLEVLAKQLSDEFGVVADPIACDVRDDEARTRLLEQIAENGKHVSVLVNNAGLGGPGRIHRLPKERAIEMVDTNVRALVALTSDLSREMVERGEGAILNVASTAAFQPIPTESVYSATKAFVLNFSNAVDAELRGTGVRCTVLCPGPTETEFAEAAGAKYVFDQVPSFLLADARDVAATGVDAMVHGKRTAIHGTINRIGAVAGSKSPRPVVLKTLETFWPGARASQ